MIRRLSFVAATFCSLSAAAEPPPCFRAQLLDDRLGDCWRHSVAEINSDGRTDVIAVSYQPARVVGHENPSWKRRSWPREG